MIAFLTSENTRTCFSFGNSQFTYFSCVCYCHQSFCVLQDKDIFNFPKAGIDSADGVGCLLGADYKFESDTVLVFECSFETNIKVEENFGFLTYFFSVFAGDPVPPMTWFQDCRFIDHINMCMVTLLKYAMLNRKWFG